MRDEAEEIVTDHEVLVPSKPPEGDHDVHASVPDDHAAEHEHDRSGHLRRHGRYGRFFLYLSLFCFSMLNLLIADNLFQVFISWELVGVCSFFLIGFYTERNSASTAANKAFIVNRIGDAGFLIGLAIVWSYFGTFNFQDIQYVLRCPAGDVHNDKPPYDVIGTMVRGDWTEEMSDSEPERVVRIAPHGKEVLIFPTKYANVTKRARPHWHADSLQSGKTISDFNTIPYYLLVIAGIGIFLGCVGKSAQFPLQTWLPDAMEGPTPVSALIHAATMVAAGVYLVGRAYPIFTPEVLLFIAYTGAITLFLAATIALVQTDIKRVLAYSTVSQLGYMMLALGVGGWAPGLFHLLTHAFFKALLFLGAGSVMHAMGGVIDMRRFSGLRFLMPTTFWTFWFGALALSGVFPFAGFWSKDAIIAAVGERGEAGAGAMLYTVLFWASLFTAFLTAFYTFRALFLTFYGRERVPPEAGHHAHESPSVMTVPLMALAVCALAVGAIFEWRHAFANFLGHTPSLAYASVQPTAQHAAGGHGHLGLAAFSTFVALSGVGLAAYFYLGDRRQIEQLTRLLSSPFGLRLYQLSSGKFYIDAIYSVLVVWPLRLVAIASYWIDRFVIDGLVNFFGHVPVACGSLLRSLQSGMVQFYALVMVLGTLILIGTLFMWPTG